MLPTERAPAGHNVEWWSLGESRSIRGRQWCALWHHNCVNRSLIKTAFEYVTPLCFTKYPTIHYCANELWFLFDSKIGLACANALSIRWWHYIRYETIILSFVFSVYSLLWFVLNNLWITFWENRTWFIVRHINVITRGELFRNFLLLRRIDLIY